MESHQCIFPVRGPREGAVGKQFSPSQRMRPSRNSIRIRWLELYSFHEANVRRGCNIIIRGNQQCLAESLFGGRQGSTGTHRHGETSPWNSGEPWQPASGSLSAPPLSSRGAKSLEGGAAHSPPPCRRSCRAGPCAALGTPSEQPLYPQVLRMRHSVTLWPGPHPCHRRSARPQPKSRCRFSSLLTPLRRGTLSKKATPQTWKWHSLFKPLR